MIRGERTHLLPLDPDNIEIVRAWINDPDINEWMLSGHAPVTRAQERRWYELIDASDTDHVFEIHIAENAELIGLCGLHKIDPLHRHAELGIFIGTAEEQGKGYGSDALMTATRFGFQTLGLHTIRIGYIDGNERGAALYPSLGFKPAGRLRDHIYLRGAFHDLVLLDMTREEFDAR